MTIDNKNWTILKEKLNTKSKYTYLKERSIYTASDTRQILKELPDSIVDCIITSPPYADLKNYGSKKQLGYGQNAENEYFPDIEDVLKNLYRISKNGGALWLVLDNLKSGGQTIPLPWVIINKATETNWKLHDVIVWDKGRSLPWSHKGRFRGVCEFILLFGKGKLRTFNLDVVRDTEHLSSYWVKYPERFHPDGKAPSDLWHFPTPIQGSWSTGNNIPRHFCPFPIELVARMINISTTPGDLIMDPFAGTGSVLSTASYLDRFCIGIDINKKFAHEFNKIGYNLLIGRAKKVLPKDKVDSKKLRKIIVKLRMLKLPKSLYSQLSRADKLNSKARDYISLFVVKAINFNSLSENNIDTSNLGHVSIDILMKKGVKKSVLKKEVDQTIHKAPLSKFGIKIDVNYIYENSWNKNEYANDLSKKAMYLYTAGNFYKYAKQISIKDIANTIEEEAIQNKNKTPSILSNIKVDSNFSGYG